MNIRFHPATLLAAVLAAIGLFVPGASADEIGLKSNLRGKIEGTEWSNQEMKSGSSDKFVPGTMD